MKRDNRRKSRISSSAKKAIKNRENTIKKSTRFTSAKTRKKSTRQLNRRKVSILALVMILAVLIGIFGFDKKETIITNSEILTMMAYEQLEDSDFVTQSEYVNFGAFFLRDLDGDGYAEKIAGTCKEIGQKDTLYFNVAVNTEGVLKNGKIAIDGKNFNLATSIVKDNVVKQNYIGTNTTEIELNDVNVGTTKLLMGIISNKDITSVEEYTQINSITLTGTYVTASGSEIAIEKTIDLTVDWYGSVSTEINTSTTTLYSDDIVNLDSNTIDLEFKVTTSETKKQLLLSQSYVEVKIPYLNGYEALDVNVIGTNLKSEYDEENGSLTITRNGIGIPRNNSYTIQISYPLEAYESMNEEVVTIQIPLTANYTGINNSGEEFENPITSESVSKNLNVIIEHIKPADEENAVKNEVIIGKLVKTPFSKYIVSKKIPNKIYVGQEVTANTQYTVLWKTKLGNDFDKIELLQSKYDEFYNTYDGSYISTSEYVSYKGIYFVNATEVLGENGAITIKDADTNEVLHKFTLSDWDNYNATLPYMYSELVKNIKIETSPAIGGSTLYIYNIKEIDDILLTTNYTKDEFENLTEIYSYLDIRMTSGDVVETENLLHNASYESQNSFAQISIDSTILSTQDMEENKIITIKTVSDEYSLAKWINGEFLIKFPKEILELEVNNIISSDSSVEIIGYEIKEDEYGTYLKILTENSFETTYEIYIDTNIIADARIASVGRNLELYYSNENSESYITDSAEYSATDIYDVNSNFDIDEVVGYHKTAIELITPGSLTTAQIASKYDDTGDITIAPQTVEIEPEVIVDNEQQTATVTVQVRNNYTGTVSETKILGKIPFEGNVDRVGNALKSTYTTKMTSAGLSLGEELQDKVTIYYSENENPNNSLSDTSNGWTTSPDNFEKVKTFLIDFEEYVLAMKEECEFSYEIEIPNNLNYNEISYSIHTVDFYLDTESGKLAQTIQPRKLGFRIAKKYDLELSKYRKGTNTLVPGMTFKVTTSNDDGEQVNQIKTTDENGVLLMEDLYVEKEYTLKEIKVQAGYELNKEEIKFIANLDSNRNLNINVLSGEFLSIPIIEVPDEGKPIIKVSLENEVKYHLDINKTDNEAVALRGIKFSLEGDGRKRILTTNSSGKISLKNLSIGTEYTLTEIDAKGYYLIEEPIKFKIIRNSTGRLELTNSNNCIGTIQENENELNPTLNLTIRNEKIPTYDIQITKVEEQTKLDVDSGTNTIEDKAIEGVQFELYSNDLETTEILTTDSKGQITINGLYEYVDGKNITGKYTLKEIYAPAGYAINENVLNFRAERKSGNLLLTIIDGQDLIADSDDEKSGLAYDSFNSEITTKEIAIENQSATNPTINLRIENEPVFSLTKIDKDTKEPLEGAKFAFYKVEYDENGNEILSQVVDTSGNIFGTIENIDEIDTTIVTTDEYGSITGNLPEGYYKAVEIEAPEGYEISETQKESYFGIGSSKPAEITTEEIYNKTDFETSVLATYSDIVGTSDGGYVSSIYFSGILTIDGEKTVDGNDITLTASGSYTDEALIKYDENGKIEWAKRYGVNHTENNVAVIENSNNEIVTLGNFGNAGTYSAVLRSVNRETGDVIWEKNSVQLGPSCYTKQLIQTSDNGYLVIGEFSSLSIPEDASNGLGAITQTSIGTKDGIIIKYDSNGLVEWYQTIGVDKGTSLIKDIVQLETGEIIAVGQVTSSGVYEKDGEIIDFEAGAAKIKLDSQGNILEVETTNNNRTSYSYEKIISDQNGYTIVSWLGYRSTIVIDGVETNVEAGLNILNYNSDDELEWFCQSNLGYYVSIKDIKILSDGSYILLGSCNLTEFHYDVMVMKVDQTGNIQWKKLNGGYSSEGGVGLVIKESSFIVAANISGKSEAINASGVTNIEYDFDGNILSTDYISQKSQTYRQVIMCEDGGSIVVGEFKGTLKIEAELTVLNERITLISSGDTDSLIIKYTKDGLIEWARQLGGGFNDVYKGIIEVDDGYIVVGYTHFRGYLCDPTGFKIDAKDTKDGKEIFLKKIGGYDGLIVKYTKDGLVEYAKNIGGTGNDYLYTILLTNDEGYIISGKFSGTVSINAVETSNSIAINQIYTSNSFGLIKFDIDNKVEYLKNMYIGGSGEIYDVEEVDNGEFVVCGSIGTGTYTVEGGAIVDGTDKVITAR